MREVRRAGDGELCGHVEARAGRWRALTVFGGFLGDHGDAALAEAHVLAEGLAALSERRWTLLHRDEGTAEVVCILEASSAEVTVARDFYPLPGVPTLTLSAADLARGPWQLRAEDGERQRTT